MGNPNPPKHTQFKKGQSGNPEGGRKLPAELRAIAAITSEENQRTVAKYLRMDRDQLSVVMKNPKTPNFDMWICSIIATGMKSGDASKLELLLNRLIGKVKENVELVSHNIDHGPPIYVVKMTDGGKFASPRPILQASGKDEDE